MRDVQNLMAGLLLVTAAACGPADAGTRFPPDSPAGSADGAQDPAVASDQSSTPQERITIRVAGREVLVELADDAAEHARGLMFRESLEENSGMLFIYPTERTLGFWMKNTLIPLDIAYADREGRIVDIQQMEPQTTETHNSAAPAMYALEMNVGWFEAHGVRVGDRIEF